MTRSNMIRQLEIKGRCYNWKRFTDKQVFAIYNKYVLSIQNSLRKRL